MSDETPVERRLREAVAIRQRVEVNHNLWPTDEAYTAAVRHTKDIDCGREAIRLLREAEATEEGGMSDEEYAAMMGRVRALLTKCREDGR